MENKKTRKRKQIKNEIDDEEVEELEENQEILKNGIKIEDSNKKRRSTRSSTQPTIPKGNISVDDEEEERIVANSQPLNQFLTGCTKYHIEIPAIQLKQQQSIKWDRLPVDTSKGLAKAAARVLLLKGGRGDKITMDHIRSALGDYKQSTRPALKAAQQLLRDTFGYDVVLAKDPDNIYVVNTIQ